MDPQQSRVRVKPIQTAAPGRCVCHIDLCGQSSQGRQSLFLSEIFMKVPKKPGAENQSSLTHTCPAGVRRPVILNAQCLISPASVAQRQNEAVSRSAAHRQGLHFAFRRAER